MSEELANTPVFGAHYLLKLRDCLNNSSIIFTHFINDFKMNEWASDTDRDMIYDSVRSGLYRHQDLLPLDQKDQQLCDEKLKQIDLITDILEQKYKEYSRNNNEAAVYFGILNLYGFQDKLDKFFRIPIIKIITSDYQNSHFVLLNGLTFNDFGDLFNFVEDMPSSLLIVPSEYALYFQRPCYFTKNEVSVFKTQNVYTNCFNECTIEINFENFMEVLKYLYVYSHQEKINWLTNKLLRTIETNSSETMVDIDNLMKIETFVHGVILWRIIEKLELTWERSLTSWVNIEKETINQEVDEILKGLFGTIVEGWIYERFKKYYVNDRKSLLANGREQETICIFRLNGTGRTDLTPFLKEISDGNYAILDVVRTTYNIKKIKFEDGKEFELIFNEIIPNQIVGCAIIKNSDAFFKGEEIILPLKMVPDNNMSLEEGIQVKIFKNLEDIAVDEKDKIEEFFGKTTTEQEFIARTQGHFNPRILLKADEETLKRFIQVVTFGLEENNNYEGLSQKDKDRIICRVAKKIIEEAKKLAKVEKANNNLYFINENFIYYDAIQIFGFQLKKKLFKKEKEEKPFKLPLFKVYKHRFDENPIIIDVDCNKYKDWKMFLERNVLGKGTYLCIPKNGRYINEETKAIEIVHLINKPIFWTPERAALVGVNTAILLGSTALALYTGPIGWGVRALTLSTPFRLGVAGVGVCSGSIGLGVTLSKKGLFISDKFQTYAPSISLLLNVTSDVLILYGETSVVAAIAAEILVPTAIGFSIYMVFKVIFEAYKIYRETGSIADVDVWQIVNSLLLFGNSVSKFPNVVKSIGSLGSKLPALGNLPALNKIKITNEISKLSHLAKYLDYLRGPAADQILGTLGSLLKSASDYFTNKISLQQFKTDLRNFTEDLIDEVLEIVEPLIGRFLKRRFGINLKNLKGPISKKLKEYIPKICFYQLLMADHGKKILRKIKSQFGLDESMEKPIEELVDNLSEPLAIEGPLEPMANVDHIMKAEEFVRSTAYKKEITKLKLYVNDDTKINPELMENVMKETVNEMIQDASHLNFKTKFHEHCSGYEKLILLEEDEKTKLYVFQYKTEDDIKLAIQEEDKELENRLKRIENDIFTYVDEIKTVLIFSDSDDPNHRLGYMLILYNEQKYCQTGN